MTVAIGSRLGAYEIAGKLGEGGMGEGYRAHDTKLKREVAIKVCRSSVAVAVVGITFRAAAPRRR